MSKRLIKTFGSAEGHQAKVYYDSEWQEYKVKLIYEGYMQDEYCTSDKQDALDTAQYYVNHN